MTHALVNTSLALPTERMGTKRERFYLSVDTLILIPAEPTYRPGSVLAEQAKRLFETFVPQAKDITTKETEDIQFIATGENLEKIVCPFCKSVLDEQWWLAAMDTAYEKTKFVDLRVVLPCCGKAESLNDLCYDWPTGFACFQLLARDPGADIDKEALQALEKTLACSLRKIWAHF